MSDIPGGYNPNASLLPQGSGPIIAMSGGGTMRGGAYDPNQSLLPNAGGSITAYSGGAFPTYFGGVPRRKLASEHVMNLLGKHNEEVKAEKIAAVTAAINPAVSNVLAEGNVTPEASNEEIAKTLGPDIKYKQVNSKAAKLISKYKAQGNTATTSISATTTEPKKSVTWPNEIGIGPLKSVKEITKNDPVSTPEKGKIGEKPEEKLEEKPEEKPEEKIPGEPKKLQLFTTEINLEDPSTINDKSDITEEQIKALKTFGLDGDAVPLIEKKEVLEALYTSGCNTNLPLSSQKGCQPIRIIIQRLVLNYIRQLSNNLLKDKEDNINFTYTTNMDNSVTLCLKFPKDKLYLLSKIRKESTSKLANSSKPSIEELRRLKADITMHISELKSMSLTQLESNIIKNVSEAIEAPIILPSSNIPTTIFKVDIPTIENDIDEIVSANTAKSDEASKEKVSLFSKIKLSLGKLFKKKKSSNVSPSETPTETRNENSTETPDVTPDVTPASNAAGTGLLKSINKRTDNNQNETSMSLPLTPKMKEIFERLGLSKPLTTSNTSTEPVQNNIPISTNIKTAVEPVAEPAIKHIVESVAEPAIEPAVEPAIEPAVEPSVEPVVEPSVEPVTTESTSTNNMGFSKLKAKSQARSANNKKKVNAAIKIQSTFKGYKTRKNARTINTTATNTATNNKKKANAAIKIQSAFKGYKTRKYQRDPLTGALVTSTIPINNSRNNTFNNLNKNKNPPQKPETTNNIPSVSGLYGNTNFEEETRNLRTKPTIPIVNKVYSKRNLSHINQKLGNLQLKLQQNQRGKRTPQRAQHIENIKSSRKSLKGYTGYSSNQIKNKINNVTSKYSAINKTGILKGGKRNVTNKKRN